MARDTGFPRADAESDFLRARRRQVLSRLGRTLLREPDDVSMILPYDEVVAALGWAGERDLGLRTIWLDTVVGSVDSLRDFDRRFRPTTSRVRARWERIALAQRRGEPVPPIVVRRVGSMHFVVDGHHRVSVANALGDTAIEAYVTEVRTVLPATGIRGRADLVIKGDERLFYDRVPLRAELRPAIDLVDPWSYTQLGESVEAWGCRLMQHEGRWLDRAEIADRWFHDEYLPVLAMLDRADLVGPGSRAEAYLRISCERYRLMRTHEWNDAVLDRLRAARG